MRLATAAYRVRHPSAEVGGSLKTYRFAFITRGDPSKLLGIAATYAPVRLSQIGGLSKAYREGVGDVW